MRFRGLENTEAKGREPGKTGALFVAAGGLTGVGTNV